MIPQNSLQAVSLLQVEFVNQVTLATKQIRGTGFWVSHRERRFIITNRHLLDPLCIDGTSNWKVAKIDYTAHRFQNSQFNLTDFQKVAIVNFRIKFANSEFVKVNDKPRILGNDVAIIEVKADEQEKYPFYKKWSLGIQDFASKEFFSRDLSPTDAVYILGYPQKWWDDTNTLPIARTGIVSSDPRVNYANSAEQVSGDALLIEAQSYGGSSGSPVFLAAAINQHGLRVEPKIIGIVAGHLNHTTGEHSGLSFILKSYVMSEMILNF